MYEIRIWKDGRKHIKLPTGWIQYSVYVAKQNPEICGEWFKGCNVHHKDFDPTNDSPENLICLTKDEHQKIHSERNKGFGIKVYAYKNNELYGVYDTIISCSKQIGISSSYISSYMRGYHPKHSKYDFSEWHFERAS